MSVVQSYPRVKIPLHKDEGLLDIECLKPLDAKIDPEIMPGLIKKAIEYAAQKTKKEAVDIPDGADAETIKSLYAKAGKSLFDYFRRPDPVYMASSLVGRHYSEVAEEFFYKRNTHLTSMNAGWRYQYLLVECAHKSGRFKSVSDLSTGDSDVNVIAETADGQDTVAIYITMKNRSDTISGGSGKAYLKGFEKSARDDKNRTAPYCCVIAYGMQTMQRRGRKKDFGNFEVWPSNFLWPFVSGYSYGEIVKMIIKSSPDADELPSLPDEIIEAFKQQCLKNKLINDEGVFPDQDAIINFFTS